MKRNLTLLTILGALIAMAIPTSAMAVSINPASHKFEISSPMPQVTTLNSLTGYCTIGKLTGTVPTAPKNEAAEQVAVPISTPTSNGCSGGESVTFSGEWSLAVFSPSKVQLGFPTGGITIRYSSLPGCKLTSTSTPTNQTTGFWSNGTTAGKFSLSAYHIHGGMGGVWADDGASCALSGKSEPIHIATPPVAVTSETAVVKDTTNAALLITVTG